MFKFLKVRNLKKKNIKASDFTKYRGYGKSKEYYNESTEEWYRWDLLCYVLDSEPKDCKDADIIYLSFDELLPLTCSNSAMIGAFGGVSDNKSEKKVKQKNKNNNYESSSSYNSIISSSICDSSSCDGGSCG